MSHARDDAFANSLITANSLYNNGARKKEAPSLGVSQGAFPQSTRKQHQARLVSGWALLNRKFYVSYKPSSRNSADSTEGHITRRALNDRHAPQHIAPFAALPLTLWRRLRFLGTAHNHQPSIQFNSTQMLLSPSLLSFSSDWFSQPNSELNRKANPLTVCL